MARQPKCRHVEFIPAVTSFKPAGIPRICLEEVILLVEEAEAIRLKDYLSLEQEECAQNMKVSRPTFQRILMEGRSKIADALINGKSIRIEGVIIAWVGTGAGKELTEPKGRKKGVSIKNSDIGGRRCVPCPMTKSRRKNRRSGVSCF